MRVAIAQINNTVGDLGSNRAKILDFARRGQEAGAEMVVYPELALTGYPPRDLVEKQSFLQRTDEALQNIISESAGLSPALLVGYTAQSPPNAAIGAQNSAVVIHRGKVLLRQNKMLLPTYDVFD